MKNTHTLQDVEGLMHEYADKITKAETKKEKSELIRKLRALEKHYNDCNGKHINGKKYPERLPSLYHPISGLSNKEKKEVYRLIDSVPSIVDDWFRNKYSGKIDEKEIEIKKELDTSGVSVGKNRFVYID